MAPHLPVLGEYFVFKLNPTQTLNLVLNDQEVSEACEALGARCKRYIGCCIGWTGVPAVGTLFPFEMSMVSRGLATYPKGFVTEDMSLPILPTTYHPRGRKPLIVDPPLPWDNCYHATPATMVVRVLYRERDVRPRGRYTLLPRHQTCILGFQRTDDDQWRGKLRDMAGTGSIDFEPPPIEDQEGIEEFYESLKTELDPSQLLDLNEVIPNDNKELTDPCPEATDDPTNLISPNGSNQGSPLVETDSTSRFTSYDSLREERARQLDYSPVIDLAVDLETVPVDELADNIFDFYEELVEMGEILMAYRAKVAAAVAEVQRKDAELDAKVAAALQSFSISESSAYETDETDVVRSPNDAEDTFQCTTHLVPIVDSLRVEIPPMSKSQASSATFSTPNGNNQPFSPFYKFPTGDTLTMDAADAITYVMNDISKSRRSRWRSIVKSAKGASKTKRMSSSNFYSLLSKTL